MYLGHITTTICIYQGLQSVRAKFSYIPFLFGALFPDLIDKSLASMTDLPGRSVFHSAVILTFLFLVAKITLSQKRKLTYAFFAGTLLHIIQDIPIELANVLWPFYGPLGPKGTASLLEKLWRYYVEIRHPISWTIEMIALPWFIIILCKIRKEARSAPIGKQQGKVLIG